jgi:hypothetical protein
MDQPLFESHRLDAVGRPAGGTTTGVGLILYWQDGPLGRPPDRQEPNGAFVESVIAAARGRLAFYQSTAFACRANAEAIEHLTRALVVLAQRTADREARGVEGTHAV